MSAQFVDKRRIKEQFGVSWTTQKAYRLNGTWLENIHWVRINSRLVRYNLQLLEDWFSNQGDPLAHGRAIEFYQANLMSNAKKKSRHSLSPRQNSVA